MATPIIILIVLLLSATPLLAGEKENEENRQFLLHSNPKIRAEGAENLGEYGIKAQQKSAMALIPLVNDPDKNVRLKSIEALGKLKWEAKRAVPHLVGILESNASSEEKHAAAEALHDIGSVKGIEAADKYSDKK